MTNKISHDSQELLDPVMRLLRDNPEKTYSIRDIAKKIDIPDKTAREVIGGLSAWGYRFELDDRSRFRFLSAPDAIFPFEIQYGLKTKYLGSEISSHYTVTSTNTIAHQMAESGAPEGTLVIAERQRGGKGRLGRVWHSPPKLGLWFSLILRPDIDPAAAPSLSILSALTLSEILRSKYKLQSFIKWPNDCLIDNHKVTGILTELSAENHKIDFVIVGMGINVNLAAKDFPPFLRSTATSLYLETGDKIRRVDLLRRYLEAFEKNYDIFKTKGLKPFLPRIKRHSLLLGKKIKLKIGRKIIQAEAHDIDSDGALLARHRKEILRVTAGEVTVIEHSK
ncbi:MAG TPA: biotin--[acetyl-CoA-carboxylase] ligase [candidate division Zixibacteria bacterium]|nr:biotin--[acetyl-CoA-carboxylase] ligase [candidate division Zixibacteria bacterium]HEQ99319.1 biotin--[acetyl-CoA-carboxylase] ligase [candidate division Zixibacteria bacterium]